MTAESCNRFKERMILRHAVRRFGDAVAPVMHQGEMKVGFKRSVKVGLADLGQYVMMHYYEPFTKIGVSPVTGEEVPMSVILGGRLRSYEKDDHYKAEADAEEAEAAAGDAVVAARWLEFERDINRVERTSMHAGYGGVTVYED